MVRFLQPRRGQACGMALSLSWATRSVCFVFRSPKQTSLHMQLLRKACTCNCLRCSSKRTYHLNQLGLYFVLQSQRRRGAVLCSLLYPETRQHAVVVHRFCTDVEVRCCPGSKMEMEVKSRDVKRSASLTHNFMFFSSSIAEKLELYANSYRIHNSGSVHQSSTLILLCENHAA
jgi:hypothetical protein